MRNAGIVLCKNSPAHSKFRGPVVPENSFVRLHMRCCFASAQLDSDKKHNSNVIGSLVQPSFKTVNQKRTSCGQISKTMPTVWGLLGTKQPCHRAEDLLMALASSSNDPVSFIRPARSDPARSTNVKEDLSSSNRSQCEEYKNVD